MESGERREVLIRLFVKAPAGMMHEIDAAIDTGFTEDITLPPDLIAALALPFLHEDYTRLSDNSIVATRVYQAAVIWDGRERSVEVQESEGTPLIGMGLLMGHLLTVQATDGGAVQIAPLP